MERALYDPVEGYYRSSQTVWKERPDYVTAPQVDSGFGAAVARLMQECDVALGCPTRVDLVDFGGGDGTLLVDICTALQDEAPICTHVYVDVVWSVERAPVTSNNNGSRRTLIISLGCQISMTCQGIPCAA